MRCQNTVVLHVRSLVAALVNKTGVTVCVCVCVHACVCVREQGDVSREMYFLLS